MNLRNYNFILLFVSMLIISTNVSGQVNLNKSGEKWLDTQGNQINAHGGGVLKVGEKYYWYGENRPSRGFTTKVGVEVYSSDDLLNWKDEGVALSVSDTKGSDIENGCIMERPKVVYCEKTQKYVMMFHLELKGRGYQAARVGFAVSDTPVGPFTFIRSLRPNAGRWPANFTQEDIEKAKKLSTKDFKESWTKEWYAAVNDGMFTARDIEGGQMSRDMTVYVDSDGKAYHIFAAEENLTLNLAELTDDYLDYTGKYIRIAPAGHNEAPAIFNSNGKYWLITSGCTGWEPNKARMFSADNIWGPWKKEDCPFVGEGSEKTFGYQGTYILEFSGNFIFMADMWRPNNLADSRYGWWIIDMSSGKPVIKK